VGGEEGHSGRYEGVGRRTTVAVMRWGEGHSDRYEGVGRTIMAVWRGWRGPMAAMCRGGVY
jgi:hypothetical protein